MDIVVWVTHLDSLREIRLNCVELTLNIIMWKSLGLWLMGLERMAVRSVGFRRRAR